METKLQISTLQPAGPTWAPIIPVHENTSQEDIGGLRSVFPSPLYSSFSFFLMTTPLQMCQAWASNSSLIMRGPTMIPQGSLLCYELTPKCAPIAPVAIPPDISFSQTKQMPAIPGHRLKHKKSQGNWRKRVRKWKHTALDCTFFSGNLGVVLHSWNVWVFSNFITDSLERMQLI